jgi:hypothetical protein
MSDEKNKDILERIAAFLEENKACVVLVNDKRNGGKTSVLDLNDYIERYERELWDSTLIDGLDEDSDWAWEDGATETGTMEDDKKGEDDSGC